jgi:hypothetical protein
MRQWSKKQESKEYQYTAIKHELRDLSNMLKKKEGELER